METFRPPGEINFTSSNLAETWNKWVQKFNNYLIASEKDSKADSVKIAILLNLLGDEGTEIFNTFKSDGEDKSKEKFDHVMGMFTEYCIPRRNVVFERFKFFSCSQQEGQQLDSYLTELKTLASTCEFGNLEEGLIRDRLVLGIREKALLERLLRESDLTLKKATDYLRAAEASKQQLETVKSASHVHEVKKNSGKHSAMTGKNKKNSVTDVFKCNKCGKEHKKFNCPAYGKLCAKCKGKNHFAIVCKSVKSNYKKVNEMNSSDPTVDLYIESVSQQMVSVDVTMTNISSLDNVWLKKVNVESNVIEFKLDTGAETNVLPLSEFKNIDLPLEKKLSNTNVTLVAYGNFRLKPEGEILLNCSVNEHEVLPLKFIVIDVSSKPILGLKACQRLNLIKRIEQIKPVSKEGIIKTNKEVFNGLGKFPGNPYHIELKPDIKPVINPPRRVPLSLYENLKETLGRLESQGIIRKVNKPTDWVNSLVLIEKPNGSLRICLDPRNLNKAIKREHHIIPTSEELISRLEGKKVFSVLDLKDGFWQVPLDEPSADLCTFNTPFGRYQFLRMPFGIASAPEVFQKRNSKLFEDIEGVQVYFDDIIVTGSTEIEHDIALTKVLNRAKECNVKFNPEKFQYKIPEVKYVGQIVSKEGIKADPQHIRAITEMETPSDKASVRRFLGMVNYVSKFIPNVSSITSPLRNLIKDSVPFEWLEEHENSFKQIKSLLSSSTVLKVFSSSKQIVIQCDSSKDGLGACLIQEGHPVSYASRSLTETEKNYAQIEKEMLAIVFSVQKYHNFVYGKKFIVQSDHKPLVNIVNKPLCNISARLQRMLLKLLKYQFEIEYIKGSCMFLADTLSRAYLKDKVSEDPEMLSVVHMVTQLPISERRLEQFKRAVHEDSELKLVYEYCKNGWPNTAHKVPSNIKQYFKIRNDLHVESELLLKDCKIVVPLSLRNDMLSLIHEGHFGIEKSKNRAREIMYWPGMSKDIESMVMKCEVCQKYQRANIKEPLLSHALPSRPFEKVGIDIMEFQNRSYLVIICYYSKWIEVEKLSNKTIPEIKIKLKNCFARYGVPSTVVSDNVPFNSMEFKAFSKEWDFECTFSSPRLPRSNGMAERAVGIVKAIFRKAFEVNKGWEVGLMEYRNTPISGLNLSPAQLLFGRRLKTKIPIHSKLLNAEVFNNIGDRLSIRQEKQKNYYDRGAVTLKSLQPGDSVTIYNFNNKTWEPGQILSKSEKPRSYIVQSNTGKTLVRNRIHLRPSNIPFVEIESDSYSDLNLDVSKIPESQLKDGQAGETQVENRTPVPKVQTRSGRVIKRPPYLKDYICQ